MIDGGHHADRCSIGSSGYCLKGSFNKENDGQLYRDPTSSRESVGSDMHVRCFVFIVRTWPP